MDSQNFIDVANSKFYKYRIQTKTDLIKEFFLEI